MSAFTDLLLADAVNSGAQWVEDAKFRALQVLTNLEDSGPIDEGEAYQPVAINLLQEHAYSELKQMLPFGIVTLLTRAGERYLIRVLL